MRLDNSIEHSALSAETSYNNHVNDTPSFAFSSTSPCLKDHEFMRRYYTVFAPSTSEIARFRNEAGADLTQPDLTKVTGAGLYFEAYLKTM